MRALLACLICLPGARCALADSIPQPRFITAWNYVSSDSTTTSRSVAGVTADGQVVCVRNVSRTLGATAKLEVYRDTTGTTAAEIDLAYPNTAYDFIGGAIGILGDTLYAATAYDSLGTFSFSYALRGYRVDGTPVARWPLSGDGGAGVAVSGRSLWVAVQGRYDSTAAGPPTDSHLTKFSLAGAIESNLTFPTVHGVSFTQFAALTSCPDGTILMSARDGVTGAS